MPGKQGDSGATGKDNRLFPEAVLWRVRTGLPWPDLPREFGNWNSEWVVREMRGDPDFGSARIDGTNV